MKLKKTLLGLLFLPNLLLAQSWMSPVKITDNEGNGNVGKYQDMIVGADGYAMIAYLDVSHQSLCFMKANNISASSFSTPSVISSQVNTNTVDLEIINGKPAIAFENLAGQIIYVQANDASGTSWRNPVNTGINSNDPFALAEVSGYAALAYVDGTGIAYFKMATDVAGTQWGTATPTNIAAQYLNLKMVNGVPALCFTDPNTNKLNFISAKNSLGTSWNGAVVIDNIDNSGLPNFASVHSMAIVSGNPAIAYKDNTNNSLRYVRATNASGSAWGTPVIIESNITFPGFSPSLTTIAGKPAVSYFNSYMQLRYSGSNDATGNTWSSAITVGDNYDISNGSVLLEVNGKPAISSSTFLKNGDLRIDLATNTTGNTWSATQEFDGISAYGYVSELEFVNGNPAIVYYDDNNYNIKYVRGNTSDGSSWGNSVLIDYPQSIDTKVGSDLSFEIVSGIPSTSYLYSDLYSGETKLKYAPAADANGSVWNGGYFVNSNQSNHNGDRSQLISTNSKPLILHVDNDNYKIKMEQGLDNSGYNFTLPQEISDNYNNAFAFKTVNGIPAIVYVDNSNGNNAIYYMTATSAAATSWNTPIAIYNYLGIDIANISLAAINGKPAIAFAELENFFSNVIKVKYILASNASGTIWGSTKTIGDGYINSENSLQILEGKPAIVYFNNIDSTLNVVQANDASGTTWGSPTILATNSDDTYDFKSTTNTAGVCFKSTDNYLYYLSYCGTSCTTGTQEEKISNVHFYPNPVSDVLNISLQNAIPSNITITDMAGKELMKIQENKSNIQLNLSSLDAGIYFINIQNSEGIQSSKVIKN